MTNKPKCPRCGKKGIPINGGRYKCPIGCGLFDNDPSEGSDVYADPSKRLERQEELEAARKFNDRRMGR